MASKTLEWLCKRLPEFKPIRLIRFTRYGEEYHHVVATDGIIRIDLAVYSDKARSETP